MSQTRSLLHPDTLTGNREPQGVHKVALCAALWYTHDCRVPEAEQSKEETHIHLVSKGCSDEFATWLIDNCTEENPNLFFPNNIEFGWEALAFEAEARLREEQNADGNATIESYLDEAHKIAKRYELSRKLADEYAEYLIGVIVKHHRLTKV